VLSQLREIIAIRTSQGFGISVHKQHYDDIVTAGAKDRLGKFHYTWAVKNIVRLIENWRTENAIAEPIEYIFDRMSHGREEIDGIFRDAEAQDDSLHRYGIYKGCHSFRDKADIIPLQSADMIAWLVYQRALSDNFSLQPHELTAQTFNYFNQRGLKAGEFTRSELERCSGLTVESPDLPSIKVNMVKNRPPFVYHPGKKTRT
jgi:hypothetical protein